MIPLSSEQNSVYLLFLFFCPVLVALVKQSGFSTQVNSLIALVVYVAVGVGAALVSDIPMTKENLGPLAVQAALVGTIAYQLFWSKLGTGSDANPGPSLDHRITNVTSLVKAPG